MTDRELLQQSLNVIETFTETHRPLIVLITISALRARLAEPEADKEIEHLRERIKELELINESLIEDSYNYYDEFDK